MMSLREIILTTRVMHPDWSLDKCETIAMEELSKMNAKRLNGRPAFWRKGHKPETVNKPDTPAPNHQEPHQDRV